MDFISFNKENKNFFKKLLTYVKCHVIYNKTNKEELKNMDKCYHITNQVLIYQEEREKPDGTPFVLETYECGECGEEYTEIKLI